MKNYKFYIDQKITTWERIRFRMEAKSEEEAIEKAKEVLKDGNECPENGEYEILYEANKNMTIEENEGNATRELYNEYRQEIANNTEIS
jgi:mannitol/fructose-specific phosphotransferase system IIA component (Ntr-type)